MHLNGFLLNKFYPSLYLKIELCTRRALQLYFAAITYISVNWDGCLALFYFENLEDTLNKGTRLLTPPVSEIDPVKTGESCYYTALIFLLAMSVSAATFRCFL